MICLLVLAQRWCGECTDSPQAACARSLRYHLAGMKEEYRLGIKTLQVTARENQARLYVNNLLFRVVFAQLTVTWNAVHISFGIVDAIVFVMARFAMLYFGREARKHEGFVMSGIEDFDSLSGDLSCDSCAAF